MISMGGTCSMQRQPSSRRDSQNHNNSGLNTSGDMVVSGPGCHRFSRHSVVGPLPDDSISHLFPISDNYVTNQDGTRSPKTLAELCTDTLCRSVAYIEGELPPGLPQDVVDDVVSSLVRHNALNATVLRVFKNCELGSLTLAGCRGVTDEWLEPFNCHSRNSSSTHAAAYHPAVESIDSLELDDCDPGRPSEVFYNTQTGAPQQHEESHPGADESSCSTSSFVSASSKPFAVSTTNDQIMTDSHINDGSLSFGDHMEYPNPYETEAYTSATANLTVLDLRGSQRLTDKGLIKLTGLSNLEIVRLDNCFSILGRGLLAFSLSHRLHTLSLANCRRLSDEAIINISHINSLEALSLDGCRCLTDRSLAAMAGLLRLKKLDLSQCDLITDDGLHGLENLEQLEELSLGWCRLISDTGVDTLTRQSCRNRFLRILSLARCPITDVGVKHLSRLSALQELDLNGCSRIGSAALGSALGQMPELTSLDVSYCPGILRTSWQGKIKALKRLDLCYSGVRDSHLAMLTDLPALEELNLDSCPVGDWAISHLAGNDVVPNLKALDLADTDLTDLGMVHLAKFQSLRRLSLFYCNITNRGLRHLAKLTSLEVLNLDSREIDDGGLWHLRHLKQLKSLDIFSGRITDTGCSHIATIKSLESLELCGGGIGDLGCAMLATLDNLSSLNLSQNVRITNRGAASLATLSHLKALNLSNTRVNSGALVYFSDLMELQSLALYGCHGMEQCKSLDRLQNGLPSLRCVRLNTKGSDDDGMIRRLVDDDGEGNDDTDETSDDGASEEDTVQRQDSFIASVQNSTEEEESDDDDEMEDIAAGDHESNSNSSGSSSYYSDQTY